MHSVPDPYRLLGLRRDATVAEIKSAHRALAKRYHPDAPGGNRDRFLALQEAYQVLADPLRRREWDRRHAPGPVRADDPISRSRTNRQPPGEPRPRPARGPGAAADAGTAGRRSSSPRPAAQPGRAGQADGASAGYTWSARDVPWWESGNRSPGARRTDATTDEARSGPVREGRGGGAEGPPAQASEGSSAPRRPTEFDVYSRSSGAAWSSAARAYFRRTTDDLPKGRYAPRPRTAPRPGGPPQQPQGPRPGSRVHTDAARTAEPRRPADQGTAPTAAAAGSHGARARPGAGAERPGAWAERPRAGAQPRAATWASPAGPPLRFSVPASELGVARGRAWGLSFGGSPWPAPSERILFATAGWLPLAVLIAYGCGAVTGCDRAAVGCPQELEILQSVVMAILLAGLLTIPRIGYYAAMGSASLAFAAMIVVLAYGVGGVPQPLPAELSVAALTSWIAAYLFGAWAASRDWPLRRPWLGRPWLARR